VKADLAEGSDWRERVVVGGVVDGGRQDLIFAQDVVTGFVRGEDALEGGLGGSVFEYMANIGLGWTAIFIDGWILGVGGCLL
jgi:hypothetical protein